MTTEIVTMTADGKKFYKKRHVVSFILTLERIFANMQRTFGKLPEYTLFEIAIRNARLIEGRTSPGIYAPTVNRLTGVRDKVLIGRISSMNFVEIMDYSLENAILRTFSDSYEYYGLSVQPAKTLELKTFYVPEGLLTTNSQDELVICPWFQR